MALTPSFTIGQSPLLPNIIVARDTSAESDSAITQRRLFVQDSYGNYLVPIGTTTQYIQWSISNSTISSDVLVNDTAASVTVEWLDVNNATLYSVTTQFCFPQFSKLFLYYLVQLNSINPSTPLDANFDLNTSILWATINGALNAIEINNDIAASQNCLDRANYMRLKQNLYF